MKSLLYCIVLLIPLLAISCASKVERYANVYSDNPNDKETPHYLILNKDGSYYRILRYGDDQFERYNELQEYGTWSYGWKHLSLFNAQTREKSEEFSIVTLENNNFGLKPTLGSGRHSNGLYRPTKEREVLTNIYQKEGHYWKKIPVPVPEA